MNDFELKAFINSFNEANIINVFKLNYKLNPQFSDFLVFVKHKNLVFAFVSSLTASNVKGLSLEDKHKYILSDASRFINLIEDILFTNKALNDPFLYTRISEFAIMFLTHLCDIEYIELNEPEYTKSCVSKIKSLFAEKAKPINAYIELLNEFGIDPNALMEGDIKKIDSKTITV